MAALTAQAASILGVALNFVAAAVGGDTVPVGSSAYVKNGSGSPITVTVDVPGNTKYSQANPDIAVTVAAGATTQIGPFQTDLANASDARVHLTYSAVTSVTVAVLTV